MLAARQQLYHIINHFGYPAEISEVPNIQFIGNASNITENDGILTVCAVAGQLVQAFTPVNVVISTTTGVARGKPMPYQSDHRLIYKCGFSTAGIDFESFSQEFSFNQSNQMHCANITILKDGVDEVDEYFLVNLVLKYAPFDIPLDTYNVTIRDSGEPCTVLDSLQLSSQIQLLQVPACNCAFLLLNCLQLHGNFLFTSIDREGMQPFSIQLVGNFHEGFISAVYP